MNYKYLKTYDRNYGATNETMRNGKYGLVPFEKFGTNSMLFWSKKKYLGFLKVMFLYSKFKEGAQNNQGNYRHNSEATVISTITCIRGSLDIDKIIEESARMRNNLSWQSTEKEIVLVNRFDIFYLPNRDTRQNAQYSKAHLGFSWYKQKHYRLLGLTSDEIGRPVSSNRKALDNLFFPDRVKDLINVISLWVKSKDWYKGKNIPWKRGWLLYGPPGTGKTALVRAFAEDLNMPIYVFSLSQMSNNDLNEAWRSMQLNIPCIALIEDIDNVFHGRKNISYNMASRILSSDNTNGANETLDTKQNNNTPLTFDCLLNCIDGVDKSDGVFTVITTNDISKIDLAIGEPRVNEDGTQEFISSRPGRIDRAIELSYMEKENKIQMADKILGAFPEELKSVLEYIETEEQETPAQFQEYCTEIAIKEFWKEKSGSGDLLVKGIRKIPANMYQ